MFDPTTLTGFHTWLSLIGLATGIVVALDLVQGRDRPRLAALFLTTAIGTSATGFLFPFSGILPSHVFGVVSLVLLALAVAARYRFGLARGWRTAYVIAADVATWLLAFVAVVQSFLKVPALHALAPTGTELPFAAAQLALFAAFVWLAVLGIRAGRAGVPAESGSRALPEGLRSA